MRKVAVLCSIIFLLIGSTQVFAADPPAEWDWRNFGKVSSVKNQGACGSSWIFPMVGALESKILIESGVELDLSEQHILSCSSNETGCGGGQFETALQFIVNDGIVAEDIFPYEASHDIACPASLSGTRYMIDDWYYVDDDAESVKQAIVDSGPVGVYIDTYADFYAYETGVFQHETGNFMGTHALLLVGWGNNGSDEYWIGKNSWGSGWAEDGYIRISFADMETLKLLRWVWALGTPNFSNNCEDSDGDGFGVFGDPSCPGGGTPDCDDENNKTYPGAPELCDGADNDCDGEIPLEEVDQDGDTFWECAGDCDDSDSGTYPGAPELCDGTDNDCDGIVVDEADLDGDGFFVCEGDCDDSDPLTYPGATEQCDGIDNNCDGTVPGDEVDGDSDGFMVCAGDCDDSSSGVFPNATEVFDGLDNNCDGLVDEDLDTDGDGIPNFNDLCDGTPPGSGVGPDGCTVCVVIPDSDGDGISDGDDQCPSSDLSSVVVIDGCDSGVANHLLPNGCTILDEIDSCGASANNHGGFVSCVSHLTDALKKDGVISGKEKGAIQSCAGQSGN